MTAWPFEPLKMFGYDLIMADPPWPYRLRSPKGEKKSYAAHYGAMTFDEIAKLPVGQLAGRDCVLFLWCTWPLLLYGGDPELHFADADASRSRVGEVIKSWGFCVGHRTGVLTADLRWVPAGELMAGEKLLAFDDALINGRRYYRWATVVSNGIRRMASYRIVLANGQELIASADHPWLMRTSTSGRESVLRWVRTGDMPAKLGHHSRTGPLCIPRLAPLAWPDRSYEAGYLSGAFDGEAGLSVNKPHLNFVQNKNAMLETVLRFLHDKGYRHSVYDYPQSRSSVGVGLTGGIEQTLRFMMEFRPPRQLARWQKMQLTPSLYNMESIKIEAVEPVGLRACSTLQTDTGTYIAEGFGAHNTYVTGGAWHKRTKHGKTAFGTGYRARSSCEPFLLAVTGNPLNSRAERNLIEGLAREHSRKPEEAFSWCERYLPGAKRCELFSRASRPGWDTWGYEAGKFDPVVTLNAEAA